MTSVQGSKILADARQLPFRAIARPRPKPSRIAFNIARALYAPQSVRAGLVSQARPTNPSADRFQYYARGTRLASLVYVNTKRVVLRSQTSRGDYTPSTEDADSPVLHILFSGLLFTFASWIFPIFCVSRAVIWFRVGRRGKGCGHCDKLV